MAMKLYEYNGLTYQIADEDLHRYPGAKLVEKPKTKAKAKPENKARTVKNKAKG